MELIILAGLSIVVVGLSLWLWRSRQRELNRQEKLMLEETRCVWCVEKGLCPHDEKVLHRVIAGESAQRKFGCADPNCSGTAKTLSL